MTTSDQVACGVVRFDEQVHGLPCVLDKHPDDRPHLDARGDEWSTVDCVDAYRRRTVLPFGSTPRPGHDPVRVMRSGPDVLIGGIPHSPAHALEVAGAIGRAAQQQDGDGRG